jgi:YcxB-like protein
MISGNISTTDYLQAQRLHRKSAAKWVKNIAFLACACGAAMLIVGHRQFGVLTLCAGAGVFISEYLFANFYLPHFVKKNHAQRKDLASRFTYSWDAQYVEAKSDTGSSRRPWSHYAKLKEDDHLFLLYHADNMFEMLPKSWFPNSEKIQEFRTQAVSSILHQA